MMRSMIILITKRIKRFEVEQIEQMSSYTIGLDIGTTAVKAVAYNEEGNRLVLKEEKYPLSSPQKDWQEQDPEQVFEAAVKVLAELISEMKYPPRAIGISAAMHSLILMDEEGKALTPSMIWADLRARAQARQLKKTALGQGIYRRTATPIHPMSPLCKILWMRENEPAIFQQTKMFLGIKGYFLFRLFGQYFIDYSLASATGLFNLYELSWDQEALTTCSIRKEQLPEAVPTTFCLPSLGENWQKKLGLSAETRWIIGASDGCLANLGSGELKAGEAVLTVGTSGAVRINCPAPLYDPQERIFCYYLLPGHYVAGGATNNGGNVWAWFVQMFGEGQSHEYWLAEAARVASGSEGLVFEPYLFGERAPLWEPEASASFRGWRSHHTKAHMARAILEGIAANLAIILSALGQLQAPIHQLIISGGLIRSSLFCEILAAKTGCSIQYSTDEQASARGAAILAQGKFYPQ